MHEVENKTNKLNDKNNNSILSNTGKESGKKNCKKNRRFIFGLYAVMTAVIIVILILGTVFYLVIHNNVNGLGERYRRQVEAIPIFKNALPETKESNDIDSLTNNELKQKYRDLLNEKDELALKLESANKTIEDLTKNKENTDLLQFENESIKKELEEQKIRNSQEKAKLEEDRIKITEIAALDDKKGYKEFYEALNSESASLIYKDILQQEQIDKETKKLLSIYENMDAASSARILEQMKSSNPELIVDIIKNINNEISAEILAAMEPKLASEITEKLYAKNSN